MTRGLTRLRAAWSAFVCRTDEEREWLLEMHHRFEPGTKLSGGLFVVTLVASALWLSPLALLMAAGAMAFAVVDRINARQLRPEGIVVGWLVAQGVLAVTVVVGGRIDQGHLVILLIPVIGACGGFPSRVVRVCVGYTALLMVGLGFALHATILLGDPPTVLIPLGLLFTTAILTTAIRQSSIEHRGAALIDPLTGMLNRLALQGRSAELEQQSGVSGQPVALLAVDIDHFKAVNDRFGHHAGDLVLTGASYRMRASLRAYDLAYRVGGEEFVVLLPGSSAEVAVALAEELAEAIRGEEHAGIRVTVSIGVAGSPAGTSFAFEDVMAAADAALYRAKAAGRDRVCTASSAGHLGRGSVSLV